jgi:hypothetical protein
MEGCAGSEKARRDLLLGTGELRNAELRNVMMGSALQHQPVG